MKDRVESLGPDTGEDALRRWLAGQDGALDEWLGVRVRKIPHSTRAPGERLAAVRNP
jgi:hypothetical protein